MTTDDAVAVQLAMTDDTWAALQRAGVTGGSLLRLDFTFFGGEQRAAEELESALSPEVASVQVTVHQTGIFRRRRVWTVTGTTNPQPVSLPHLREWVERMVRAGAQYGLEFDGWGADVSDT
ncbi:hypothetical protein GCM10009745_24600 [Kribbella yunnanensis]|uniref:Regulator of ribonuclease activity B domain-containing protein n=1 Tax=Kribbella yunnanensis TaxID=190194 RepID=A0ABN2H038_9ACTN